MNAALLAFRRLRGAGAASLVALLLGSCDLLRERPFEVVSWSPGIPFAGEAAVVSAGVRFSSPADRESVEKALSLAEDGAKLRGDFLWVDDRSVSFFPYAGFSLNREYRLSVETGASDEQGVSLPRAFSETFFTRADGERPRLLSVEPEDGAVVSDERTRLRLEFSVPVDASACRDHISVSPALAGAWSLSGDGLRATFMPASPWTRGQDYRISVSPDMVDRLRIRSGIEYRSRFSVGADRIAPTLARAEALDDAGGTVGVLEADDGANQAVNGFWEATWRLALHFSKPVSLVSVDGALSCSGGPSLVRETRGETAKTVVYRFSGRPAWDSLFSLRLGRGVKDGEGNESGEACLFRVRADGPASRPPRLVGIRLPMVPAGAEEASMELRSFSASDSFSALALGTDLDRYPIGMETATIIEVYLETAAGAVPSLFSFMDAFRVGATNGALSFSPRSVKLSGYRLHAPHEPWAGFSRVEVGGVLVNRTSAGVVSFLIASGCADSAGNATSAEQALPLLK